MTFDVQVNTLAAERLYTLAGDWANLNSDTLLFDVCCGTGTIGLTLAHRVGMVISFPQFMCYKVISLVIYCNARPDLSCY